MRISAIFELLLYFASIIPKEPEACSTTSDQQDKNERRQSRHNTAQVHPDPQFQKVKEPIITWVSPEIKPIDKVEQGKIERWLTKVRKDAHGPDNPKPDVKWNVNLAQLAGTHADESCHDEYTHADKHHFKDVAGFDFVLQNWEYYDPNEVPIKNDFSHINRWERAKETYESRNGDCGEADTVSTLSINEDCEFYKRMMWHTITAVGCAKIDCNPNPEAFDYPNILEAPPGLAYPHRMFCEFAPGPESEDGPAYERQMQRKGS